MRSIFYLFICRSTSTAVFPGGSWHQFPCLSLLRDTRMISRGACPLQLLFSRLALSVRLGGGGICAWADLREGRSRRASKTCVRCDLRTTFGLVVDLLFSECARARFSKDATTGTLAFEFLGCCGVNDTRGMAPIFLFAFG